MSNTLGITHKFLFFKIPVKFISKISIAILIGLIAAFGFTSLFLNLLSRSPLDQLLLLFFTTSAFGYLTFFFLEQKDFLPKKINLSFQIKSFIHENLAGIILAFVFFLAYFYIALQLNPATLDTVDNFLDADNSSWMRRIAHETGAQLEMRGPHPFAYLFFRPLGFLLNIFTNNFALSAIFLNVLAGAICVFLTWLYFKRQTQNTIYALLIASLLGISTAHFFFGSVVETYIFSALFLIFFFVLLQNNQTSLGSLVFVSLITFGITITNFAQTFIGFFLSRPRFKDLIRFTGLTLAFGIILSLLQAIWYPSSKLFFLPSDAQAEQEFTMSIFQEPTWRVVGRVLLLIRTILLYTIVAPKPYVFTEEVGGTFPRFNFFKIAPETFSYSSYDGLGSILIMLWIILLLGAGLFFMMDVFRSRKLDIRFAYILCILFNFALHINYGYEPFLYSPDWAYALIFFIGLSLLRFEKNKIFQGLFFIFLCLLAYNQWQFFQIIFQTIEPFIN